MVLFRFFTIQEMSFKSQSEITQSWATYVISVLHVILHLWVINVFQHHQRLLTAAISLAGLWSEYEPTITMRFLAILFGAHVGMVLFRFDTIQEMSFKSQSEITHSWATYVTPHTFLFYMWYFNSKFHLYSNTMTGFQQQYHLQDFDQNTSQQ